MLHKNLCVALPVKKPIALRMVIQFRYRSLACLNLLDFACLVRVVVVVKLILNGLLSVGDFSSHSTE